MLFRTGHDSDLLELELTRRGIPFVKYGGLRYLEAAHVKDLVALLRLVDNPADELSWFRVLQLLDGVGPVRARSGARRAARGRAAELPELERWEQARGARARQLARDTRARLIEALRASGARARAGTSAASRSSGCARRSRR